MVGPDYQRPTVEVPETFLYQPNDVAAEADLAWWKRFEDPVLDQLIDEALANNKSVKIAAARVDQAAGALTTTRAAMYPQIGYQGSGARQRFSEEGQPATGLKNPDNSFELLAGASWEIDFWGRIRRQTEAARANLLATEEARRGVILSLVSSMALNYLELRSLDGQLEVAERTLANYGESLRLMELQFKYGRVSLMNVEQARTRFQTAATEIPLLKRLIVERENAISILLGNNPHFIPRGKSIAELTMPEVPPGLPSELLERRPDLRQAEQNLIAANAQIGAAKALYYPSINLTALLGTVSTGLGGLFSGPARVWSYAGTFTGPIFTAGSIEGQVVQAEAGQEAALLAYQQAIQNAFADVENSLNARTELINEVAAQEKLVTAQSNYAHLARVLYDGGYEPYSTVLQAEEQLLPAELKLVQVKAQRLASLVNIYKAMGGGWVDNATSMADQAQEISSNPTDVAESP
jgi:multidrug efflux system outer membrane protein